MTGLAPLLIAAALGIPHAHAVERTETLECELAGGAGFVLRASHQWFPMAAFARHAASRSDQKGFEVAYRAPGAANLIATGATLDYHALQDRSALEDLCARLGIHDGQPGTGQSLRLPGETQFWVPGSPGAIDPAQLKQRGLHAREQRAVLAVRDGRLAREVPLVDARAPACANARQPHDCAVAAVARSLSDDRGASWQPAVIDDVSWFFRTGVPLAQQPGLARPAQRSIGNFINSDEDSPDPANPPCPNQCAQ